ncbi:MAG: sulfatase-like hydrolase/transferase [bacterium]|nr:sulfatase-like hydrolase/transferase [bacterium]
MNQINRRQFVKEGTLSALSAAAGFSILRSRAAHAQNKKPNIIYIMADDLGYGNLGCYGQSIIQTPNLDRMATEGMRFTQCYAGSTVCAPSRCCLMTGYHTGHARIRGNKRHPLLPEDVTVAEILKENGYKTGIVGKWGLGAEGDSGIPNRQGFDFWYGYLDQARAHNYFPDYLFRNEEREYFDRWTYSHDAFMKEASNFIKESKDEPFFLYLAITIPHAFNEGGENGMPVPSTKPYTGKDWPQMDKNFAAMVTRMDADLGKLFAQLKDLGLDDNTIIFFTSDNGPHREGGHNPNFFDDNGPLRGIKRDLYEGGIRVPMIVRWPGVIEAGAVSDQPWAFWDFLPTAAELAGGSIPGKIDGISMVNALKGQPQRQHDFLYWEFHEGGFSQAVRMGDWKAVRNKTLNNPIELYNLRDDLAEQHDVADRNPGVMEKIRDFLASARTPTDMYPVQ